MYNYTVGVVVITNLISSYLKSRSDRQYKLTHEMPHSNSTKRLGDIQILLHNSVTGVVMTKVIVELKITDGFLMAKHIGQTLLELKYAEVETPVLLIIVVGKGFESHFYQYENSEKYKELPKKAETVPSLCKATGMTIGELDGDGCKKFVELIDGFLNSY